MTRIEKQMRNEYRVQLEIVAELEIASVDEQEKLASIYSDNSEKARSINWTDELKQPASREVEA